MQKASGDAVVLQLALLVYVGDAIFTRKVYDLSVAVCAHLLVHTYGYNQHWLKVLAGGNLALPQQVLFTAYLLKGV